MPLRAVRAKATIYRCHGNQFPPVFLIAQHTGTGMPLHCQSLQASGDEHHVLAGKVGTQMSQYLQCDIGQ